MRFEEIFMSRVYPCRWMAHVHVLVVVFPLVLCVAWRRRCWPWALGVKVTIHRHR